MRIISTRVTSSASHANSPYQMSNCYHTPKNPLDEVDPSYTHLKRTGSTIFQSPYSEQTGCRWSKPIIDLSFCQQRQTCCRCQNLSSTVIFANIENVSPIVKFYKMLFFFADNTVPIMDLCFCHQHRWLRSLKRHYTLRWSFMSFGAATRHLPII